MHSIRLDVVEPRVILNLGNLLLEMVLLIESLIDGTRRIGISSEYTLTKGRLVEDRSLRRLDFKDCRVVG